MFTSKGQFVAPPLPGISGIWQCLQTFLVVTTWGVGATGSWVGRGQGCCNERDRLPQQRSIPFQVSTVLKLRTPTLSYYIFHLLLWFGEAALQADQDAPFLLPILFLHLLFFHLPHPLFFYFCSITIYCLRLPLSL